MLQIDLGMRDEAQLQIDHLRKLSRVSRYEQQARQLEQAIARARQSREASGENGSTKARVEQ